MAGAAAAPPLALLLGATAAPPRSEQRADIIFHVIDDLGWNDLGFRNPDIDSPALDALARGGVVLTDYHTFMWCSPTRSSFMTGRIPFHNGFVTDNGQPRYSPAGAKPGTTEYALSKNFTTLPSVLKGAGYATHAIGKWHLGSFKSEYVPTGRGFDTFLGYLSGAEDYFFHNISSADYGNTNHSVKCNGLDFSNGSSVIAAKGNNDVYSAGIFGAHAADVILSTPAASPLYVYLAWQSVHSPVQAPAELISEYQGRPRPKFMAMVKALDDAVDAVQQADRKSVV